MAVPLFDTRTPLAPLRGELDAAVARVLDADAVVVATNHHEFRGALHAIADGAKDAAVVADPWDTFGAREVFGTPRELLVAQAARA